MNLRYRLLAAAALTLAGFVAAFWFAYRWDRRSNDDLLRELTRQRHDHFKSAGRQQGLGLEAMAASYAWQDEMVRFVDSPDPQWATEHVNNLVGGPHGGDAVWVLDTAFKTIHTADADFRKLRLPVDNRDDLRRLVGQNHAFQYFTVIGGNLWQIFGAAIHSAKVPRGGAPARGFLLVGKRWDEAWLARLGAACGAHLTVKTSDLDAVAAAGSGLARGFRHEVEGLDARVVAHVHGRVDYTMFREFAEADNHRLLFLGLWALATLGGIAAFVVFFLLHPLDQINRSLETKDPLPIADLLTDHNVFGDIARHLVGHLRRDRAPQEAPRRPVAERPPPERPAPPAPPAAAADDTPRIQLAGNLPQGSLGALDAISRQLAAIEADAAAGGPLAADRLAAVQGDLARAVADLRRSLPDPEPAAPREQNLASALRQLEKRMWSIAGWQFSLEFDDRLVAGTSREAQFRLFAICHELAENALRHARPGKASLSLVIRAGTVHLSWLNDGVPPRPAEGSGRGLRDIQGTVQGFGGQYWCGATGDTWRVEIEVPYTSLVTPVA